MHSSPITRAEADGDRLSGGRQYLLSHMVAGESTGTIVNAGSDSPLSFGSHSTSRFGALRRFQPKYTAAKFGAGAGRKIGWPGRDEVTEIRVRMRGSGSISNPLFFLE